MVLSYYDYKHIIYYDDMKMIPWYYQNIDNMISYMYSTMIICIYMISYHQYYDSVMVLSYTMIV